MTPLELKEELDKKESICIPGWFDDEKEETTILDFLACIVRYIERGKNDTT